MKKKVLILLLFVSGFVSGNMYSQEITLTYNGGDRTNATMPLFDDVEMHIDVTNTASTARDIVIEITAITLPHKAPTIYTCWNVCTYPDAPIPLGSINIGAGETNSTNFHVTYSPDGNDDPANVTFHVYENGTPGTYVSLVMDSEFVSVKGIDKQSLISIYPNPATENVTLEVSEELLGATYRITDLLGKQINSGLFERNSVSLALDNYTKGIYFVSIYNDGILLNTKKLIIR